VLGDQKRMNDKKEMLLEKQFEEFKRQANSLLLKEDAYENTIELKEKERLHDDSKKLNGIIANEQRKALELAEELKNIAGGNSA